jgi:hypothetical protein
MNKKRILTWYYIVSYQIRMKLVEYMILSHPSQLKPLQGQRLCPKNLCFFSQSLPSIPIVVFCTKELLLHFFSFYFFKFNFTFYCCVGVILWHLQKFLQYIKNNWFLHFFCFLSWYDWKSSYTCNLYIWLQLCTHCSNWWLRTSFRLTENYK